MSVLAPGIADTQTYFLPSSQPLEVPRPTARPVGWSSEPGFQAHLSGDLGHHLVAIQPLPVNIERDEDSTFIVSDDIFLVYGHGDDLGEALYDYVASLREFYSILQGSEDLYDQRQFGQLQAYVQAKPQRGYDAVQANRD